MGKRPRYVFPSLGATLDFRPAKGSLIGKKNQKNYRFSKEDNSEITNWLKENVKLGWVEIEDIKELKRLEKELIQYFCPLVNLNHNPLKLPIIPELRAECRKIATLE